MGLTGVIVMHHPSDLPLQQGLKQRPRDKPWDCHSHKWTRNRIPISRKQPKDLIGQFFPLRPDLPCKPYLAPEKGNAPPQATPACPRCAGWQHTKPWLGKGQIVGLWASCLDGGLSWSMAPAKSGYWA